MKWREGYIDSFRLLAAVENKDKNPEVNDIQGLIVDLASCLGLPIDQVEIYLEDLMMEDDVRVLKALATGLELAKLDREERSAESQPRCFGRRHGTWRA